MNAACNVEKQRLMNAIYQCGFAISDITLFLDRSGCTGLFSAYETQIQPFRSRIRSKIRSPYPDRRTKAELLAVGRVTVAMGKGVLLTYVEL